MLHNYLQFLQTAKQCEMPKLVSTILYFPSGRSAETKPLCDISDRISGAALWQQPGHIHNYTVYTIIHSLDIYRVCKQFMLLHNTCDKGSPYTNSDNCNPLCRNLVQCKLIQCHAIKFNVYLLWVWFRARASIGLLVTMWSMTYWGWASFVSDITKVIRHAVCLVGVLCFWHKSHLTRTKQFQQIIFWLICAQL